MLLSFIILRICMTALSPNRDNNGLGTMGECLLHDLPKIDECTKKIQKKSIQIREKFDVSLNNIISFYPIFKKNFNNFSFIGTAYPKEDDISCDANFERLKVSLRFLFFRDLVYLLHDFFLKTTELIEKESKGSKLSSDNDMKLFFKTLENQGRYIYYRGKITKDSFVERRVVTLDLTSAVENLEEKICSYINVGPKELRECIYKVTPLVNTEDSSFIKYFYYTLIYFLRQPTKSKQDQEIETFVTSFKNTFSNVKEKEIRSWYNNLQNNDFKEYLTMIKTNSFNQETQEAFSENPVVAIGDDMRESEKWVLVDDDQNIKEEKEIFEKKRQTAFENNKLEYCKNVPFTKEKNVIYNYNSKLSQIGERLKKHIEAWKKEN
ncbi:hypothetical protein CDIK_1040 [Cucumispora dikerogammari]|nr:hypothetical protein CDIK_1040 [Cucumispora dikerogammari]